MSKTIVLNSTDVKVLMSCKSTDELRSNLYSFHITESYIETTDGHKLVRIPLNECNYKEDYHSYLNGKLQPIYTGNIFSKVIKINKVSIKANQELVFGESTDGGVTLHIAENNNVVRSFFAEYADLAFPETDQVIPDLTEDTITIGIGIPLLKDIVNAYVGKNTEGYFKGKNTGCLQFTISTKDPELAPFKIVKNTGDNEYTYYAMPWKL